MNIQIAIIENEISHTSYLLELLKEWEKNHPNISLLVDTFTSGQPLLEKKEIIYDLIFLDIELDDLSGLDIAHILRDRKFSGELVFLTSHQEYVFSGYDVKALNYLLKPIAYEKLSSILSFIQKQTEKSFFITKKELLS